MAHSYEDKIAYLNNYRWIMLEHARLSNKLYTLVSRLETPKTSNFSNQPRSTATKTNAFDLDKKDELTRELEIQVRECNVIRKNIETRIKEVESYKHRIVLEMKYLDLMTYEQIADGLGFDVRHVKRLHKHAVHLFDY